MKRVIAVCLFILLTAGCCIPGPIPVNSSNTPKITVSHTPKITVSHTPKPTPTPEPTVNPAYKLVAIKGIKTKKNSIGVPMIHVDLINRTKFTLDAISYAIKCENNYEEPLQQFGFGDTLISFIHQGEVKAGGTLPNNTYATLNGFETATIFYVAIIRYHIKDGDTVDIPMEDWIWKKFK